MHVNVINAQMSRGKTEKIVGYALASVASTLNKFSMDVCMYAGQDMNFISLPVEYTTGSSIMPHKRNPDVFELVRARCNKIASLPFEYSMITTNLPSGYHRDMQILKESYIPSFSYLSEVLSILNDVTPKLIINEEVIRSEKYNHLFTVEAVNKKVLEGIPFREAYKEVGAEVEAGLFLPAYSVDHDHTGSIGNLSNHLIEAQLKETFQSFKFGKVEQAINLLLGY
jgi:argininosuccinate lyase